MIVAVARFDNEYHYVNLLRHTDIPPIELKRFVNKGEFEKPIEVKNLQLECEAYEVTD